MGAITGGCSWSNQSTFGDIVYNGSDYRTADGNGIIQRRDGLLYYTDTRLEFRATSNLPVTSGPGEGGSPGADIRANIGFLYQLGPFIEFRHENRSTVGDSQWILTVNNVEQARRTGVSNVAALYVDYQQTFVRSEVIDLICYDFWDTQALVYVNGELIYSVPVQQIQIGPDELIELRSFNIWEVELSGTTIPAYFFDNYFIDGVSLNQSQPGIGTAAIGSTFVVG